MATAEAARFLDTLKREHATTMKVLRAFPADQAEFRPHPRSNSARTLAWTFVIEQIMLALALKGELRLGAGQIPQDPPAFPQVLERYEQDFASLVKQIDGMSADDWKGTIKFPVAKGQIGEWEKLSFAWFMLHDQIHHRGQYTVYLRMAGGKVPSIYGPSGDDPWF